MNRKIHIGVDIGGTFTDIVAINNFSDQFEIIKVPSIPNNYTIGIKNGIQQLLTNKEWDPSEIDLFFHGTTIATNTVIEKKGALTALLTTEGFRDVLEVGRTSRPPSDLYNLSMERPTPLVPRHLRFEISERIDFQGNIVKPLNENTVKNKIIQLVNNGIESLAVCLINSYKNPVHERIIKDIANSIAPNLYTAISSNINPQFKEFERTSTTTLSAYVGPKVSKYIQDIENMLSELDIYTTLHVMQASGGAMTASAVKDRAIYTILSGPAAGVLGAQKVGMSINQNNLVTFDMGGTSTDVSLINKGQFKIVEENKETGYHLRIPMMDIITIGAGGGSIAEVDSGGVLKVGPKSAGAKPGPACYGEGEFATVTDAHLVLGVIDPKLFLGGKIKLNIKKAKEVIQNNIAKPLEINIFEAASGIIRVANANMLRAIKRVSIQRGHDLRDFCLIPFGGSGGLHAGQLINELGMKKILIPFYPGVLSACGLVEANLEYQHVQTILKQLDKICDTQLDEYYLALEEKGKIEIKKSGINETNVYFKKAANIRYYKQIKQVTIELNGTVNCDSLRQEFINEHKRLFGYVTDEPIEVVDLRVATVYYLSAKRKFKRTIKNNNNVLIEKREIYFEELKKFIKCPVYYRENLYSNQKITGPAVVEQEETSILLRPNQNLKVFNDGNLIINVKNT